MEKLYNDEHLGTFELDYDNEMLEGELQFNGTFIKVSIEIDTEDINSYQRGLRKLKSLTINSEYLENDIKQFIAKKYLDLANSWSDDTYIMSEADFIKRLIFEKINIYMDSNYFCANFSNDEIFTDHWIEVEGCLLSRKLNYATLI